MPPMGEQQQRTSSRDFRLWPREACWRSVNLNKVLVPEEQKNEGSLLSRSQGHQHR